MFQHHYGADERYGELQLTLISNYRLLGILEAGRGLPFSLPWGGEWMRGRRSLHQADADHVTRALRERKARDMNAYDVVCRTVEIQRQGYRWRCGVVVEAKVGEGARDTRATRQEKQERATDYSLAQQTKQGPGLSPPRQRHG
jgi:hypothetical protein